jgi:hypothetical protein
MPDAEVKGWLDLLNGGGNVAAMVAVYLAVQVLKRFEAIMGKVALRLERIERCLVARDPAANRIIGEPDPPPERQT